MVLLSSQQILLLGRGLAPLYYNLRKPSSKPLVNVSGQGREKPGRRQRRKDTAVDMGTRAQAQLTMQPARQKQVELPSGQSNMRFLFFPLLLTS